MTAFLISRCKSAVLLCIYFACSTFHATAQTDSINFTSLTSKNGLSSNTVNAILKDRYGWMWFGTEDGLNRFDGSRFTVYRHKENEPNSLPVNDITCLHEDKAGNLWVGTNGGSLNLYDRKNDAFINVNIYEGGYVLKGSTIRTICSDDAGRLWIGCYKGLYIIDPATGKLCRLPAAMRKDSLSFTRQVNYLYRDSQHTFWIGTANGLFRYDKYIRLYRHSDADSNSLICDNIKTISEDGNGNIWIGTSKGLSMLRRDGNNFRNFRHRDDDPGSINCNQVFAIAADANRGKLWIGTEEGLCILDPVTGLITRIAPDKRRSYGLTGKSLRSIYIDPQGIYWLGLYQGGISKYDKNLALFQLRQSNVFDVNGLNSSVVTSFAESNDNRVFIGTDGGGLNVFNRKSGLFSHMPLFSGGQKISSLTILSMEMDRNNQLWIGSYGMGLFRLNPATGSCRRFQQGSGTATLNNNDIFCIKEAREGDIWIGTNGGGVNVYNSRNDRFHTYNSGPGSTSNTSIPLNGYIRGIEEDENGDMWIGSYGTGIVRVNPKTGTSRLYNKLNSDLPANVVLCLLRDSHNNIWVGTAGGGLSLLNKQTGRFLSYSEKDGLSNAVVYKILEDNNGILWTSTNTGISSFDVKTRRFTNYSHFNGVQNNNFVLGSGIRLRDGEIYFGGLDGFNFFNPRLLPRNKSIPAVVLTELRVANQPVIPSSDGPIQEQVSIANRINLNYKQSFSLSFTALDYTSAQQNTFAYKLEGFDKDWNYVGASKTASYTNLDPGDYTFRVKVKNSDGVWNTKGASIAVHIRPPLWRTVYAYMFYVVLAIGIFLFYRHKTLQKLKRKFAAEQEQRRIEQQQKEAAIARQMDEMKIRFLTNLSHEFRTPISLIMGPVDNLLLRKHDEVTSGQLQMVRRNARRLLNLVNQLLDFRKMEENELAIHASEDEAIGFIKEVFDSFKDLSERKKISYSFSASVERLFIHFDHDKLERILFNLLSNAFKFTPAEGSVKIALSTAEHSTDEKKIWLNICVSDTGIGIPESKKEKIFERFFQINSASVLNQGSGIGLSITQEFVKMQGGTIGVESKQGTGTTFKVSLPFHLAEIPVPEISYPAEQETITEPSDKPVILLVEDDDEFRAYLKDNLRRFFKVIEAGNGKEGWQKALAHHPLIVISDITMPVMDGIQLSNKIKADKRTNHIPVILLTALTGEKEQLKGLATGANDYVTKPFNFEILYSRIRNLLLLNHSLKATYSRQIQVHVPEKDIESPDALLMKDIRSYIEGHLIDSQLSVDQLSRHVGMSRSSLYSKMLELTGQSPIEYIRSVKLEKAAVLLEKSGLNMAQVAYETGFATPNYFAKSFKAKFNMLPSQYASSKRKKPADKI
ncbi:MAG TPA: two-component regulator propeller domain-containing protein [Chitinophaga sp.]|nr:two-component regulator propeller domain-containing protein [Chitinophaga sp.]